MNAYGYPKKSSRVRVGDTIGAARAIMPAGFRVTGYRSVAIAGV